MLRCVEGEGEIPADRVGRVERKKHRNEESFGQRKGRACRSERGMVWEDSAYQCGQTRNHARQSNTLSKVIKRERE